AAEGREPKHTGIAGALEPKEILEALDRSFAMRPSHRVTVLTAGGEPAALPWHVAPEQRLDRVAQLARQPRYANLRSWLRSHLVTLATAWGESGAALGE